MKNLLILIFLALISNAYAQEPIQWTVSSKKIASTKYEIHFVAQIASPWHIYSQNSPAGGAVPTNIIFRKNPIVSATKEGTEKGNLIKKYEDVFGLNVLYYEEALDISKIVTVKVNVKTALTGTIEFMLCNNKSCLPPKLQNFSVPLE